MSSSTSTLVKRLQQQGAGRREGESEGERFDIHNKRMGLCVIVVRHAAQRQASGSGRCQGSLGHRVRIGRGDGPKHSRQPSENSCRWARAILKGVKRPICIFGLPLFLLSLSTTGMAHLGKSRAGVKHQTKRSNKARISFPRHANTGTRT